jgi:hypothetical protein
VNPRFHIIKLRIGFGYPKFFYLGYLSEALGIVAVEAKGQQPAHSLTVAAELVAVWSTGGTFFNNKLVKSANRGEENSAIPLAAI